MPTLGIEAKLTLATKQARTNIYDLYRGISVDGVRQASHALDVGSSITIDLTNSSFIIITAIEDYLDVEFLDTKNTYFTLNNVGFLVFNASNLKEVTITNNYSELLDVYVFY